MDFEGMNKKFQSHKAKILLWNVVLILSFVVMSICYIIDTPISNVFKVIAGFMFVFSIVVLGLITIKYKEIDSKVLQEYILPTLNNEFKEFQYDAPTGINEGIVRYLNFISGWNRIEISNHVQGYYRNVSFVESGVLCEYEYQDMEGDYRAKRKFSGRVIVLGISLLDSDEYVEIVSQVNSDYRKPDGVKKATLNYELEKTHDIYVSSNELSLF